MHPNVTPNPLPCQPRRLLASIGHFSESATTTSSWEAARICLISRMCLVHSLTRAKRSRVDKSGCVASSHKQRRWWVRRAAVSGPIVGFRRLGFVIVAVAGIPCRRGGKGGCASDRPTRFRCQSPPQGPFRVRPARGRKMGGSEWRLWYIVTTAIHIFCRITTCMIDTVPPLTWPSAARAFDFSLDSVCPTQRTPRPKRGLAEVGKRH